MRMCTDEGGGGRKGRRREQDTPRVCMCTQYHGETAQFEYILEWREIASAAMKNEYFQVHIPIHTLLYLKNVQERKSLCMCCGGGGPYMHTLLKTFLSADNCFMKCNKHPKNSK